MFPPNKGKRVFFQYPEVTHIGHINDILFFWINLNGVFVMESALVFNFLNFVPGYSVLPPPALIQPSAAD